MEIFMELSDEQWEKVKPLIPSARREGRPRSDDRRTLNAILFVLKAHIPWNYLPREYGDDATANRRFRRWKQEGVWNQIAEALRAVGYRPDEL
ncbi:MAG: transposase [Thaumarchaeota archaeon]|nr:transposase [Nitrososphaerota archaeon]